ncbi:MAG: site-specific integrase [Lachnospiraceae bacterium]|nr:site-specific integrase [Lachnospiraceae bacterium]
MSVNKDKESGKWRVYVNYKDWQGNDKVFTKRGFRTKREAREFEREFLLQKSKDMSMSFERFTEIYLEDIGPRLKLNTMRNKKYIIAQKILPYFGKMSIAEITPTDVMKWQNELMSIRDRSGRGYTPTYLRTIQNQLSAIFNHACRYYALSKNPSAIVGKMGSSKTHEMMFWTREEYQKFAEIMKKKPVSYYAFEILYWTGIRLGELLALERADIDLEKQTLNVNKSFQRIDGKDLITSPKTENSYRVIDLPSFLCREMEDYFGMIYGCQDNTRLFEVSKSYLHHEMDRGAREAGVKRIRLHDLRHSHVALLIDLGFSTVDIAKRLGHEGPAITYTYAHLFPSKGTKMAQALESSHDQGMEEIDDE